MLLKPAKLVRGGRKVTARTEKKGEKWMDATRILKEGGRKAWHSSFVGLDNLTGRMRGWNNCAEVR